LQRLAFALGLAARNDCFRWASRERKMTEIRSSTIRERLSSADSVFGRHWSNAGRTFSYHGTMPIEDVILEGKHVRLEPLERRHIPGLVAAAGGDPELYRWSPVPQNVEQAAQYVDTALEWRKAGKALAFATLRASDGVVIGSTRFFDVEHWFWPDGHPRHKHSTPDVCEIGYTWLNRAAIRTLANTEAKFLMMRHAFENWKLFRVCLHTDVRNERSRAAIERIGGKFEGILRAHRMAADFTARDSARYSIIQSEWPAVKERLLQRMARA
jgi:N-acetyltransferase